MFSLHLSPVTPSRPNMSFPWFYFSNLSSSYSDCFSFKRCPFCRALAFLSRLSSQLIFVLFCFGASLIGSCSYSSSSFLQVGFLGNGVSFYPTRNRKSRHRSPRASFSSGKVLEYLNCEAFPIGIWLESFTIWLLLGCLKEETCELVW